MTKAQQGLARQATIFITCGGKALTALVRMLLLSLAVLFEAFGRALISLEKLVGVEVAQMDRTRKRARVVELTYKALPDKAELVRLDNPVPTAQAVKWRYGLGVFGRK